MTLIRNADRNRDFTGICGASSLVGKEGYAVKVSSNTIVLAADTDNNTDDARIYVLTMGADVGQSVSYATPGSNVAVIVADGSASVDDKMMVNSDGKFVALSGSGKYASVKLLEAVTAAGQIVEAVLLDVPGVGA